jgi:Ca2+-binding RTX toxin-like protein
MLTLAALRNSGHGFADVKNFGAVGDGKADDTAAILRAAAHAKAEGLDLKFSSGTYRISKQIRLDGWQNASVYGENATLIASSTYKRSADLEGMLEFNNGQNLKVFGLTVNGNEPAFPDSATFLHAFRFKNTHNVEAAFNTTTQTVGNGFNFSDSDNPIVHHNTIDKWYHGGIEFKRSNNLYAGFNTITGTGDKGTTANMKNDHVSGGTSGILITGTATGGDPTIEPPHSGAVVEKNVIRNVPGGGIKIEDQNNVKVLYNEVHVFGKDGIKVHPINQAANTERFVHDALIKGNVLSGYRNWRGDGAGYIALQSVRNGVVEDNLILGNEGKAPAIVTTWRQEYGVLVNPFLGWGLRPENVTVRNNRIYGTKVPVSLQGGATTLSERGNVVEASIPAGVGKPVDDGQNSGGGVQPPATPQDLKLVGNNENSLLNGKEGNDELRGDGFSLQQISQIIAQHQGKLREFLDAMKAASGNDTIIGGAGNDTGIGGLGNDVLEGGAGADKLYGDLEQALGLPAGSLAAGGLNANDRLWGEAGTDFLNGGYGNDAAMGGSGNDTVEGADGNDALFGDDEAVQTIVVRAASDRLDNVGARFRLLLDGRPLGVVQEVKANLTEGQLETFTYKLSTPLSVGKLALEFLNDEYKGEGRDRNLWIDSVQVNGTTVPLSRAVYRVQDETGVLSGRNRLYRNGQMEFTLTSGAAGNDTLDGGRGSDSLYGGGGDDVLRSGLGETEGTPTTVNTGEIVLRVAGDHYNGAPQFRLLLNGQQIGGLNTVSAVQKNGQVQEFRFKSPSALSDKDRLEIQMTNDAWGGQKDKDRNLYVHRATVNGKVLDNGLARYQDGGSSTSVLRSGVNFVPGSGVLTYSLSGVPLVIASAAAAPVATTVMTTDYLDGGTGNDTLIGGSGNDIYAFNKRGGSDVIDNQGGSSTSTDIVQFGVDVSLNQLRFQRDHNDLVVRIADSTGDRLTLKNWYSDAGSRVDKFRLDDGRSLASPDVQQLVNAMSSFNSNEGATLGALPQNVLQAFEAILAAVWK